MGRRAIRRWLIVLACLTPTSGRAADPALTEREASWLAAGLPVLRYAAREGLSIDVVVQPDDQPDLSPVAMGIRNGRCTLVVSMRGNAEIESLSNSVPLALFAPVAEAIFAHEVAHCWRSMRGDWHSAPAEPVDAAAGDAPGSLARAEREMRLTRREEGYADLVGLAWTLHAHADRYEQVRAWLSAYRREHAIPGDHHDTGLWIELARDRAAFTPAADLFVQANLVWQRGLQQEEP